jgi:phosphatidylserine decarboxylase
LRIVPVASDAWRFVVPLAAVGAILVALDQPWSVALAAVVFLAALFCLYFFRDFNRLTPPDDKLIYCPGDGKILDIETVPAGALAGWKVVRIFLSVLDGHVQRSPVSGRVAAVEYKQGTFLDARHNRAHLDNEQNALTIDSPRGRVIVKQIAGLIARRIVCWVRPGATLSQGERYGLIRFGSQVDLVVPPNVEIDCKNGDRVVSGRTVLAHWK